MAEFALGQAAMVQNGNWGWSQINGVDGNTVKAEDVKFLPIYTGVEGEENQGLCTGTENFFCINKEASAEDQAASIAFVEWLFSSETGKAAVTNDLGFIAPFDTFSDDESPPILWHRKFFVTWQIPPRHLYHGTSLPSLASSSRMTSAQLFWSMLPVPSTGTL